MLLNGDVGGKRDNSKEDTSSENASAFAFDFRKDIFTVAKKNEKSKRSKL